MDFGKILTRSWNIIWKNKALWIFGILASCGSQAGGGGSSFNFGSSSPDGPGDFDMPPGMRQFFFDLERRIEGMEPETLFAVVAALIAFGAFVGLIFLLLSVFGRLGVIKGALQADTGGALRFRNLVDDSAPYFLRSLGLNLLLNLVVFVAFLLFVLFAVIFGAITLGVGVLCLVPFICLLIPLAIAYGVYVELSNVALVSEDLGIRAALGRGWQVLRDNLANIALMAVILIVGGSLISFLISMPLALVAAPAMMGLFLGDGSQVWGGLAISGICLLLALPLVILAGGILRGFILTAWTLSYTELTRGTAKPAASAKAVAES